MSAPTPPPAAPPPAVADGKWRIKQWGNCVDFASAVARALAPASAESDEDEFAYMCSLTDEEITRKLQAAKLEGHTDLVLEEVATLRKQRAATGGELNQKFAADGANELTYGSLETFNLGLDGLLGPPKSCAESGEPRELRKLVCGKAIDEPTLLAQIGKEHGSQPDSFVLFPDQKDEETVKPDSQLKFVIKPAEKGYHPGTTCAKTKSTPIYGVRVAYVRGITMSKSAHDKLVKKLEEGKLTAEELMEDVKLTPDELRAGRNIEPPEGPTDPDADGTFSTSGRCRLGIPHLSREAARKSAEMREVSEGAAPLRLEELVGGQLYTGSMYLKYNHVLRFFSGNEFLLGQCVKYQLGKIPASGLAWQELGEDDFQRDKEGNIKMKDGSEQLKAGMFVVIENAPLAAALRTRTSFSQTEFDGFQVATPWSFLSMDCVIVTEEGKRFKPSAALTPDADNKGFQWSLAPLKYGTTIHVINSCIVKLAVLTKVGRVYRGVAGKLMPARFFKKDEKTGISGGVEYGFSSATDKRETATFYAKEGDEQTASTVLEAHMGMVDRGADISWLSQYPEEKEIAFNALMAMEVLGTRVDGATLVIEMHMSANQKAATLEQAVARRHALLKNMAEDILIELPAEVREGVHPGKKCVSTYVMPIEGKRYVARDGKSFSERGYEKDKDATGGSYIGGMYKLHPMYAPWTGPLAPLTAAVCEERLALASAALRDALLGAHAVEWFNGDVNYTAAMGVPLMVKGAVTQALEAPMLRLLGCASPKDRPEGMPLLELLQAVEMGKAHGLGPIENGGETDEMIATRLEAIPGEGDKDRWGEPLYDEVAALTKYADPKVVAVARGRMPAVLTRAVTLLPKLEVMDLPMCKGLTALPDLSGLERLQTLSLFGCEALTVLPAVPGTSLQTLQLYNCNALKTVPDLSAHKQLKVRNVPRHLKAWEQGGFKALSL